MTKAKLVILRHGQTEHNKKTLMTGQLDIPLTTVGEEQARAAGKLIGNIRFDKVYSSNLSRAFNTAALALESSGTQVHLLNKDGSWQIEQRREIAELDTGLFTGRDHRTDPEIINYKRDYHTPLPGGESEEQLVTRVQKFFDTEVMPRLARGENVLVVAHAGILRVIGIVLGFEEVPETIWTVKKHTPNAAPTVYNYEGGVLASFSDPANQNIPPVQVKKRGPKL
ncbi:MAG: histidine phosphatase family protein [Proteobacteria bacterium]|nr:histidine phosphatase family protein [Pseudomonadota bacterium]